MLVFSETTQEMLGFKVMVRLKAFMAPVCDHARCIEILTHLIRLVILETEEQEEAAMKNALSQ